MVRSRWVSACSAVSALIVAATFGAQAQQPPPGGRGGRGGRGGTVVTSPRNAYPDRTPDAPEAIERGKALYGVNCQFCHGADTRGGDSGPSLLRSGVILDDQHGELMAPVVRAGRPGMPKFTLTDEQVSDIASFVHTFKAAGYDESRQKPPSIVVGDARAGEAFFGGKCASCHSVTGDLRGIATKIADARLLQQTWLLPGSGVGRGGPPPVELKPTTVTVTLASGQRVDGVLDRIDDFTVSLTMADGTRRSFQTTGDTPKVEVHDPLQPHKALLRTYSDTDIHNVTAFLVTLK